MMRRNGWVRTVQRDGLVKGHWRSAGEWPFDVFFSLSTILLALKLCFMIYHIFSRGALR